MEDRTAAADRLTPHDLRTLAVGEAIVTWRDQMFKLALFSVFPELDFANIRSLQLRANHFVRVRSPDPEDLGERQRPDYPLRNCGTVGKNVDIDFDLIFEKDARLGKKN
jgi:hypothetical protein